jgi:hypothetical protein
MSRDICFFYRHTDERSYTIAYRRSPDRTSVRYGVSVCRNDMDQFAKRLGRKIANGRLDAGRVRPGLAGSVSNLTDDLSRFEVEDVIAFVCGFERAFLGSPD